VERERFLGRVAAALRGADLPEIALANVPPEIRFDNPMEKFVAQATAADADVYRAAAGDAIGLIGGIVAEVGKGSFIGWDDLDGFLPGATERLEGSGLERVDARVSGDPQSRRADHLRVGGVAVGITGADLGIAASGSVVLQHGPGRSRAASLLVEHHIALLPVDRIVHSLADVVGRIDLVGTSNVVVITGPSRTGDIDSVLTLGVHGPRHLHIVVVEPGSDPY
jgi:L-lactate dehydrogenase complex protein LldG